jgi:hypothetical protein
MVEVDLGEEIETVLRSAEGGPELGIEFEVVRYMAEDAQGLQKVEMLHTVEDDSAA